MTPEGQDTEPYCCTGEDGRIECEKGYWRQRAIAAETKVAGLESLLNRSLKALRDLSTEEIVWQMPSEYWTETDCPGDQMWDTIHLLDAALSKKVSQ